MRTCFTLPLCLLFIGGADSLMGEVKLRQESSPSHLPWATSCGGGTLAAFTLPVSPSKEAVPEALEGWNYFAQSIIGNGQRLTGFAFYGAGLNSPPVTYTISILDYGSAPSPVDSVQEFNPEPPGAVVATASFVLGKATDGKIYFEFTGDDSVLLNEGRAYVLLIAPAGNGIARFYRMPDGASYSSGACAKGPIVLNPGTFNKSGADRDAVFALYTTAP